MQNVANYKERVRTLFCANCGIIIDHFSIKKAEQILHEMKEKNMVPNCMECAEITRVAACAEDRVRIITAEHTLAIEKLNKQFEEEIELEESAHYLAKQRLAQIRTKRQHSIGWHAHNN